MNLLSGVLLCGLFMSVSSLLGSVLLSGLFGLMELLDSFLKGLLCFFDSMRVGLSLLLGVLESFLSLADRLFVFSNRLGVLTMGFVSASVFHDSFSLLLLFLQGTLGLTKRFAGKLRGLLDLLLHVLGGLLDGVVSSSKVSSELGVVSALRCEEVLALDEASLLFQKL